MAFRDYSQQFAPVNVFGGLGKGLGEGLGRGVTKSIRRPLFKKLADKFRTENEAKAQLNTLAQMGLQAPPVQGDTQYPIFQDMMAQNLSVLNQRPDRAQELWETDQEAAQEYLLGEDKLYAAKGGKGKDGKEALNANPQALADATAIVNLRERLITEKDPAKRQQLTGELVKLEGMYEFNYGEKAPSRDTLNQYRDAALAPTKALKEQQDINKAIDSKVTEIWNQIPKAKTDLKAKIGQAVQTLLKLRTSQTRLEKYKSNWNPEMSNAVEQAAVIKELGLAIEPGLQVTEGEVKLFQGENWAQSIAQGLADLGDGIAAAFGSGGSIDKVAQEAGSDNPEVVKYALMKASEVVSSTQQVIQEFIRNAAASTKEATQAEINTLVDLSQTIPLDLKPQVKQGVDEKILTTSVPSGLMESAPMSIWTEADFASIPTGEEDAEDIEDVSEAEAASDLINSLGQDIAKNATSTSSVVKGVKGKIDTSPERQKKLQAKFKNGVNQDKSAWEDL